MTRSGALADMCGTFSYFTHYVPYVNYCGNTNMGLLEGTYLAMRNELILGEEYCKMKNLTSPYKMRRGSNIRLYLPSTIAYGEAGTSTEGGYEGQYSLDASRPFVLDIEVLGAIKNPSEKELSMVQSFIGWDGNWEKATKPESEKTEEDDDLTLKGLYYSVSFNPQTDLVNDYRYIQPHLEGTNNHYEDDKMYKKNTMSEINKKINDILIERFGTGLSKEERTEERLVTKEGRANVWYILRFLDGFVVDSNIAEIRKLVFNETDPVSIHVVVKADRPQLVLVGYSVHVEMKDRKRRAFILVYNGKGRRFYASRGRNCRGKAAYEGGLAHSEIAVKRNEARRGRRGQKRERKATPYILRRFG